MQRHGLSRDRGFTLIELLVVIAIIAVLMGLLMPSLRAAKEQAKRSRCMGNFRQIHLAMVMYADTYDQKVPPSLFTGKSHEANVFNEPWRTYNAYHISTALEYGKHIYNGPWNLGILHAAKLVDDG